MTAGQKLLIAFYALVAAGALYTTWSQNLAYMNGDGAGVFVTFLQETKANPASRSITVDIGFFLLAAAAFMVIEARRLGVRFVWVYILFGFLIAISVTFPLFMIARELRLVKAPQAGAGWTLTATDLIGLAIVTAVVLSLTGFVLS
ncbi:DUF2834 domain-containing protein [Terricaulis sp.]|uniref:DUF2834 domain-containing protein n=1 Tax=Terricaulis sp. TaxID=2768686 RepID=UPI003782D239